MPIQISQNQKKFFAKSEKFSEIAKSNKKWQKDYDSTHREMFAGGIKFK